MVGSISEGTVADQLRVAIVNAEFSPGERLVELQLAERFGVGRAVVRSALAELEKEGLIGREANRGATVRRLTVEEAIQINEARAVLEALIAERAARVATSAERKELRRIVGQMQKVVGAGRFLEYSELNGLLHRRLREISRHEVARDLVENLRNRAAHHQFRLALMPNRPAESLRQHEAIVEAVVNGDEAGAALAMKDHLASVIEVLRHWAEHSGPV